MARSQKPVLLSCLTASLALASLQRMSEARNAKKALVDEAPQKAPTAQSTAAQRLLCFWNEQSFCN
ncbi:MAG TPA: hypothetical protein VGL91_08785 [Acidobacteriota bacterium]|jgi:hypothetical protein